MANFDPRYARVTRVRHGRPEPSCSREMGENEVEVELATNEPPREYAYFIHVESRVGLWYIRYNHN